jgi:hypothetical protein
MKNILTNTKDIKDIIISSFTNVKHNEDELLQINDFNIDIDIDKVNRTVTRVKTYEITKIGGGRSGALIYKIQDVNRLQTKQILKIYKEKSNLEKNIREISVYCTIEKIKEEPKEEIKELKEKLKKELNEEVKEKLEKEIKELEEKLKEKLKDINIKLLPFPKLITKGYITKDSELYPETPYIITTFTEGEKLSEILINYKKYLHIKDNDDKLLYNNYRLFYDIMKKILESLLNINKIISFSHEDLHPGNIMIKIDNNKLEDITIIDFDLSEIGDIHYDDNKINPVKRPYTRRITRCVPDILNDTIKEVFKEDKDIYNDFLKKFNNCPLFRSLFNSNKEFNKIKLDRVVVIYYLFIFGYILKDIGKNITEIERKIQIHREKGEYYTKVFFTDYDTLINSVSIDTSNEVFYNDALNKFQIIYYKTSHIDMIRSADKKRLLKNNNSN